MDRPVARPLTDEEQAELSQLCEGALFLLPSPEDVGMSADDVDAGMLPKFVGVMAEAVRRGFELPITVSTDELAMRLGALYGDEISRLAGWEWEMLAYPNGLEALAVVSPDRALCVLPLHVVGRVMADTGVENILEGLFTSIVEGELPLADPGRYVVIG